MQKLKFEKIVIVGLGLMGASLAADIKKIKMAKTVIGVDTNSKHRQFCQRTKLVQKAQSQFNKNLYAADLILLALPVRAIVNFMKEHGAQISPATLVMDVGSTKRSILKAADQNLQHGQFVGCHPMAGTEKAGPTTAKPKLFQNKACFILPSSQSLPHNIQKASQFWQALGSQVVMHDVREHDQILASISHLPQLLASLLSIVVLSETRRDVAPSVKRGFRQFLGGGFKDMIRIASSPSVMWRDIFFDNADNLLREITRLQNKLALVKTAIRKKDLPALEAFMQEGAKLRKSL